MGGRHRSSRHGGDVEVLVSCASDLGGVAGFDADELRRFLISDDRAAGASRA